MHKDECLENINKCSVLTKFWCSKSYERDYKDKFKKSSLYVLIMLLDIQSKDLEIWISSKFQVYNEKTKSFSEYDALFCSM
jgi:hypothetical protein